MRVVVVVVGDKEEVLEEEEADGREDFSSASFANKSLKNCGT